MWSTDFSRLNLNKFLLIHVYLIAFWYTLVQITAHYLILELFSFSFWIIFSIKLTPNVMVAHCEYFPPHQILRRFLSSNQQYCNGKKKIKSHLIALANWHAENRYFYLMRKCSWSSINDLILSPSPKQEILFPNWSLILFCGILDKRKSDRPLVWLDCDDVEASGLNSLVASNKSDVLVETKCNNFSSWLIVSTLRICSMVCWCASDRSLSSFSAEIVALSNAFISSINSA